jgi:hypothetical protein
MGRQLEWRPINCRVADALLALVRQPAAGGIGARSINRPAALLDVGDLAILVYDEGGAIGNPHLSD